MSLSFDSNNVSHDKVTYRKTEAQRKLFRGKHRQSFKQTIVVIKAEKQKRLNTDNTQIRGHMSDINLLSLL